MAGLTVDVPPMQDKRMNYAALVSLILISIAGFDPRASFAQTDPPEEREVLHDGNFGADLNALCGAGQNLNDGCAAIRAREIVDASEAPWRAVGRVNFASTQIRSHCTGTLVSERIVVTAAHCLYTERRKSWIPAQSLRFVAGYQRGAAVAVSDVKSYILDPVHDTASRKFESDPSMDWALLVLRDPIGLETGFVPLASMAPEDMSASEVLLAGYAGLRAHVLSVAKDCGSPVYESENGVIMTGCAAMNGDSGAPLLILEAGKYRVIGALSAVAIGQDGFQNLSVPASAFSTELRTQLEE